jgi:hypothetical protein
MAARSNQFRPGLTSTPNFETSGVDLMARVSALDVR